jgi:biotin carboxyl carrier protein
LVLDIKVHPGDAVKKGDTLLILEAMKMENAIKSPIDAIIKSVEVTSKQAVDKNAILVHFQ